MLCYIAYATLCYITYAPLCYITYVMLYNICYVMLYLTIIPRGHVGCEMIDSQRGA